MPGRRGRGRFGRRKHRHCGRPNLSQQDMMILNQWTSPTGGVGFGTAPFTNYYGILGDHAVGGTVPVIQPTSNYYGILGNPGTPGGARATLSSPGPDQPPPPYSAVTTRAGYIPESEYNRQYIGPHQWPVGFEGAGVQYPPAQINPAPSISNATLDYRVTTTDGQLKPVGHNEGEQFTDHFPQPGRSTPDPLGYMHQAPDPNLYKRKRRPETVESGCCVVS